MTTCIVSPTYSDEYIDRIGKFFEWNALHERYGWDFEWYLKRCSEGNAPAIPSFNWGSKSNIGTFDTNNDNILNIS